MAKKVKKKREISHKKLFLILVVIAILLGGLDLAKARGLLIPEQPKIEVEGKVIYLDSMSLEQKIAQMVIVGGIKDNYWPWKNMQVGGIHLFALQTENIFNNTIIDFQYGMPVPFFVTADLEGCVTPFAAIRNFTSASEIKTIGEAYETGFKEGAFLKHLGFNLDFSPVVDLQDQIWKCRSFPGNEKQIAELAEAYISGLQAQGIMATAKHYPGKTLEVKDPHKYIVTANIDEKDLYPYRYLADKGKVDAIMVSHLITSGAIDSEGIPSVVSPKVIGEIKQNYSGLIISDEIHMLGLKKFYETTDEMYIAVFRAGNDIILDFDSDPNEVYRMIQVVKKAVEEGEISEEQIDASVTKILQAKGFIVK